MAAAFALLVAAAFALLVATALAFLVATTLTISLSVALALAFAMAILLREILSVKTLIQLLLASLANTLHLSGKMQGLAGHRVVEIHSHSLVANLAYGALNNLSC